MVVNIIKKRIIITDDSITHVNIFRTKQISFKDIKGCRVGQKVIYIVSNTQQAPNITITNYIDFADSEELSNWFKENFRDLNAEDYETDLTNVLNDSNLGISEDERKAALSQARVIGYSYNIIGIILLVLSFFIKNNVVFEGLLLVYPIIAVFLIAFGKGLLRLIVNRRSPFFTVFLGIYTTILALFIRSFSFEILNFDHFWLPFISVTAAFVLGLKLSNPSKTATSIGASIIWGFLIFGCCYGYVSVRIVNSLFDNSAPKTFPATVLDHSISHNKGVHYHIFISEWGPQTKKENIDVSQNEYYQDTIGSTVSVHLKKGVLSIPWYIVSR